MNTSLLETGQSLGIFATTYHLFGGQGRGGASLVAQKVKNLLSMQEMWVQSLGQEDPLEEGMATHSRIPAWRIPCTEESGRLQSMEPQGV